jgi:hypothetical protein
VRWWRMSDVEAARLEWGERKAAVVCPHCGARGGVRAKTVERKGGVSGAKATAAVLTGGLSVLATGLARTEALEQLHCSGCTMTWTISR